MWQLVAAVGLWWVASTATTIASRSVMLQEEDEADLRWPVHEALSDLRLQSGPPPGCRAELNPSIIPTAFLGSCMIFTSLSLAALYSERSSLLFLGGFLKSGLSMLLLLLMVNLFIGSYLAFQFELYFGLLLFCGFVLFDTQLIVEKFNSGSDDYIWHSVDLFLDFVNIFRRLLVILASKEKKRKN